MTIKFYHFWNKQKSNKEIKASSSFYIWLYRRTEQKILLNFFAEKICKEITIFLSKFFLITKTFSNYKITNKTKYSCFFLKKKSQEKNCQKKNIIFFVAFVFVTIFSDFKNLKKSLFFFIAIFLHERFLRFM